MRTREIAFLMAVGAVSSAPAGAVTLASHPVVIAVHRGDCIGAVKLVKNLRSQLIDAPQEINKAWRNALAAAPKPDPAHLDDETIVLPIDVDMTLETGREPLHRIDSRSFGILMRGDVTRKAP